MQTDRNFSDKADFNAILDQAQANKHTVGNITNAYDLQRITFSAVPNYGAQHALRTQRLAEYIARREFKLPPQETLIVGFAALLHDLARTQPFHGEDPGHRAQGLVLAHEALTQDPQFARHVALHERVLALLAAHNLDSPRPPTDPLAICLHDADAFEALRHAPDTEAGRRNAERRLSRVVSPWAKSPMRQRHYAQYCGWKHW